MRSTKSKTENNQLPCQVEAERGPTFLPFHTCVEQSPICLVNDHEGPCGHKNCLMAVKHPQWYGISISELYNKYEFTEFDMQRGSYGPAHLIPRNPNLGVKGFELFRQSMNAVIHLSGSWPMIDTVPREDVEFKWIQHIESYPISNPETGEVDWRGRLDTKEHAFYIGSIKDVEFVMEGGCDAA